MYHFQRRKSKFITVEISILNHYLTFLSKMSKSLRLRKEIKHENDQSFSYSKIAVTSVHNAHVQNFPPLTNLVPRVFIPFGQWVGLRETLDQSISDNRILVIPVELRRRERVVQDGI